MHGHKSALFTCVALFYLSISRSFTCSVRSFSSRFSVLSLLYICARLSSTPFCLLNHLQLRRHLAPSSGTGVCTARPRHPSPRRGKWGDSFAKASHVLPVVFLAHSNPTCTSVSATGSPGPSGLNTRAHAHMNERFEKWTSTLFYSGVSCVCCWLNRWSLLWPLWTVGSFWINAHMTMRTDLSWDLCCF